MSLNQQSFWQNWKTQFAFALQRKIVLAVSGGRDSITLAHLLSTCNIDFCVAHVNFHLRGKESDEDTAFVQKWCALRNIVCYVKDAEIEGDQAIQERARAIRYQWFQEILQQENAGFIVTAHHADDNAETVLMNLARGTGIKGMHGILPVQKNILRPLLPFTSQEIAVYALAEKIEYRNDSSNESDKYLRNQFRHQVLPAMTYAVPNVIDNILQTSQRIQFAETVYQQAIETWLLKLVEQRGQDYFLPLRKLMKIKGYQALLYEWLQPYQFTSGQMQDVYQLLHANTGQFIASPTHQLIKNRDFFILTAVHPEQSDWVVIEKGNIDVPFQFGVIKMQEVKTWQETGAEVVTVDEDKLTFPLMLRPWKQGDYLYPLGMQNKKKKVARLLIDAKMPLHHKERVYVLCSGDKIVWVLGLRLDERFKVKPTTENLLQLTWIQPQ